MKPILKTIIIGLVLSAVGLSLAAADKINRLTAIFEKMSIKPASLPKNIQFSMPNELGIPQIVTFEIDLRFINPDFESFSAYGFGLAQLTSVAIYLKNTLIGTAIVNLDEIDIPAQSEYILRNLPVMGNTLSILANATSFANLNLNDLRFITTIEVAGIEYEIGN